jgi:hypothetical protein
MSLNGPTLKESCTVLQCFPSIVNCPSQHRHCEEVFGIVLTSWNNVLAWASEDWTQHRQETVRGPGLGFETVHHPHHITVQGRGLGLTFPPRPNDKKRARMSDGAAWGSTSCAPRPPIMQQGRVPAVVRGLSMAAQHCPGCLTDNWLNRIGPPAPAAYLLWAW